VEYLEGMIRGETVRVFKLNQTNLKYQRLDFVSNAVAKEKHVVSIENDLMRTKIKI
jgi:hypothetical protein